MRPIIPIANLHKYRLLLVTLLILSGCDTISSHDIAKRIVNAISETSFQEDILSLQYKSIRYGQCVFFKYKSENSFADSKIHMKKQNDTAREGELGSIWTYADNFSLSSFSNNKNLSRDQLDGIESMLLDLRDCVPINGDLFNVFNMGKAIYSLNSTGSTLIIISGERLDYIYYASGGN